MSRNKDRLGGPLQQDASPPAQSSAGGFSFVVPTEIIDLPSGGRFYPVGHPLSGASTLEIKQMTAKEEDILTSQNLIKKGLAVDRLIHSVMMDKSIDPSTILVGDRNAIVLSTRVSGYGNIYETSIQCPACSTRQDFSFDLNSSKILPGKVERELGATIAESGLLSVRLPKTQVDVEVRLLTGRDEKAVANLMSSDNIITQQLRMILVSVNGDTSPETLEYVIQNIPSADSRHLRMVIKEATPNVDMTQNFTCSSCKYEKDLEVPLTSDFFWPKR